MGIEENKAIFFSNRQVLKCFVIKLDLSVAFVTVACIYLLFTIYVRVTATIPERKKNHREASTIFFIREECI